MKSFDNKYLWIVAKKAHILIPCGKTYEGNEEKGKQNPGHPCPNDYEKFPKHDRINTKRKMDYESPSNGCECSGMLSEDPFLYIEGERSGNGSICRIELFYEKENLYEMMINVLKSLYASQNGNKQSISYYKTGEPDTLIFNKNLKLVKRIRGDKTKFLN